MSTHLAGEARPATGPAEVPARPAGAAFGAGRLSPSGRWLGLSGALILLALLLVAVFAPLVAGYDPLLPSGLPNRPPGDGHLLGTNDIGQDIFAQLVYGTRVSLAIGLLAALFAVGFGLAVALVAGELRGVVEAVLMRLVDLTLAFPFLPLVVVVAAFLGRELWTTILVIAAVIWARPARVLRSQVLKVREYQHVTAARAMGSSTGHLLGRHLLPRVAPLAAAQFVRAANVAVLLEASLAFLGLGDPNRVSWGTILFFANTRNAFLTDAWLWWMLPPGLGLTALVLAFAFVGYAVEEWSDPRLAAGAGFGSPASGAGERSSGRAGERVNAPTSPAHPLTRSPAPCLATPDTVIEVRELEVSYDTPAGPVRAVDGVSLTVRPGRVVGLVGESGCGKSTLAMALLGLVRRPGRVAGGTVVLNGRELGNLRRAAMARVRGRQISLVPQSAMNALNPAYPALRQVAEAAALTRAERAAQARAAELLEIVGIPPTRRGAYPHELSGGMRQRVVIAMAIANEPSLLVADEPVTGLDVITQARILRLLLDLRARFGLAILLISHDLPLVARVADELLVMYAGRIVESGPAEQARADPRHPYTRGLLGTFPHLRGPRQVVASIPGEPPDLLHPPLGCRFQPRCPLAFGECAAVDPPLFEPRPGQRAACLLERP